LLNPHTKLDIDWEWFNDRLDRQDGCERITSPHLALKQQIADGEIYYNTDNCSHHVYNSDTFRDWLPTNFLISEGYTGEVLIKVLEHPPASFTEPHTDGYGSVKRKFGLPKETNIKRLWIPCIDYKFGHAFFIGNEHVVINYSAGDVYDITPWHHTLHSGVNAGVEIRRTMTITGPYSG
tara:strand:- start:324 stop:860 length:537 start_codon:yes stop_codon:yes gene_type:complete